MLPDVIATVESTNCCSYGNDYLPACTYSLAIAPGIFGIPMTRGLAACRARCFHH